MRSGRVIWVGTGPGAADLVTWRAVECLRQADVVFYDVQVNPRVLSHAPVDAARVLLDDITCGTDEAHDVTTRMLDLAQDGKTVIRLTAGDGLTVFPEAGQKQQDGDRDIRLELVPGIPAYVAAAARSNMSFARGQTSCGAVWVMSREGGPDGSELDYVQMATFPGTLVFDRSDLLLDVWARALINAGKSAATPAVMICHGSLPEQVTCTCTLDDLANDRVSLFPGPPTTIVVVGPAAAARPSRGNWFEQRPMFGRTVMVTRPSHQNEVLVTQLEELGARVVIQPAIEVSEPPDWGPLDDALMHLSQFDWVVFSSVNGVRATLERLDRLGLDLRAFGPVQLAAIGPATVAELWRSRLRVDRQPDRYQAEDLAATLTADAAGKRFLLVRASRGREVLAEQLRQASAEVVQVVAYASEDLLSPSPHAVAALRGGNIDWVTVTSSAIARSLVKMFADDLKLARLASISPITSSTLTQLGFEPSVEADQATMQSVVEAIVRAEATGVK